MTLNNIESVEIYSKPSCPFCVKAKELLSLRGIPFDEYIAGNDVSREDIQNRLNVMGVNVEVRTVPQIFASIGGEWHYIGGFTELSKIQ